VVRVFSLSQTILQKTIGPALGLILFFGPPNIARGGSGTVGIIKVAKLNMRQGPFLSAPRLKLLQKGDKVLILKQAEGWLKVDHQGLLGYIKDNQRFVQVIADETSPDDTAGEISRDDTSEIKRLKDQTQELNQEIQKFESELKTSVQKETSILNTLNRFDLALNQARQKIAAAKSEKEALDQKVVQFSERSETLTKDIEIREIQASKRLVALYKLNLLGKITLLTSAESMYELLKRKNAIERILTQDERMLDGLRADKTRLSQLLKSLDDHKAAKLTLESDLKRQIQEISLERAKRNKILKIIRNQTALEKAAIGALKQASQELNQTIQYLTQKEAAQTSPIEPPKPFVDFKGLLRMPVNGKIVSRFGRYVDPKYNITNFQRGIDIKADKGDPVHAVYAGRIIFAGWFKGYGNMIIIDHGNNYYTVYAHTEELFKQKGDRVEADEVIATVGESGSMIGSKLHFEVRHHGNPINPLVWIKKG